MIYNIDALLVYPVQDNKKALLQLISEKFTNSNYRVYNYEEWYQNDKKILSAKVEVLENKK